MKLIKFVLIGMLTGILGVTSCKKEETPNLNSSLDDLAFDKKLTRYPLSEIRAKYSGADVTLGEGKISGIVISETDNVGNPSNVPAPVNHVIIQDGHSGIVLDFGESHTKTWPLYRGDSIVVKIAGSVLTRKSGAMYITGLDRAKMQVIGYNGNNTGPNNRVKVRQVTVQELMTNFSQYESTLVRVRAEITPAPLPSDTYSGNKVLTDPLTGATGLILHTEANAVFANQPAPPAAPYVIPHLGNFTGIAVSADGVSKQIWMRNLGDAFAIGAPFAGYPEGAETINSSKTSYLPAESRTFGTGSWLLDNAVRQTTATDIKNGTAAFRFPGGNTVPSYLAMNFNVPTASKVVFKHANWEGTPGGGTLQLEYSINNGTTWVKTGQDVVVNNTALTAATFPVNFDVPVRFRIKKLALGVSPTNERTNIDDIIIYSN